MKKKIAVAVAVVLLLVLLGSSVVVTAENEYTLIRQFGRISKVVDQPGVSLKLPFVQTVDAFPKQTLLYDLVPSEVITRDKKNNDYRQLCALADFRADEVCADAQRFRDECREPY